LDNAVQILATANGRGYQIREFERDTTSVAVN
jgi:hypothetical protein